MNNKEKDKFDKSWIEFIKEELAEGELSKKEIELHKGWLEGLENGLKSRQ